MGPFAKFHIGLGDNTVTRYEVLASGDRLILLWELECSFSIHAAARDARSEGPTMPKKVEVTTNEARQATNRPRTMVWVLFGSLFLCAMA